MVTEKPKYCCNTWLIASTMCVVRYSDAAFDLQSEKTVSTAANYQHPHSFSSWSWSSHVPRACIGFCEKHRERNGEEVYCKSIEVTPKLRKKKTKKKQKKTMHLQRALTVKIDIYVPHNNKRASNVLAGSTRAARRNAPPKRTQ